MTLEEFKGIRIGTRIKHQYPTISSSLTGAIVSNDGQSVGILWDGFGTENSANCSSWDYLNMTVISQPVLWSGWEG